MFGAGAIGGVVGGRLFQSGHDVVLIARGDHHRAIARSGLALESAEGTSRLPIPVVDDPSDVTFEDGDIVLLAVKSQHTVNALEALSAAAPASTPIVCAQNGVNNERAALRRFPNVYAMSVNSPCAHLEPGVVQAYSAPTTGILDLGRYPHGVDSVATSIAEALNASSFNSEAVTDVMRWKWAKLLSNLGNAVEVVCGPPARRGPIGDMARAEGVAVLAAAGINHVSEADDVARRGDLLQIHEVGDQKRQGGSSWQSFTRRTGDIETDYLNGEIVLQGRLHGVPTPVNELLQRLASEMAHKGEPPGAVSPDAFLAALTEQRVGSRSAAFDGWV